jgi:hypothetical protein
MVSVEDAYRKLAAYVLGFVGRREWESAGCRMQVFSRMATGSQWLMFQGRRDETGGFEANPDVLWDGLCAATFLRDDLLRDGGQRIWAVAFTLYPDGRFDVEYDYNKPENYAEADELLAGE